MYTAQEVFWHSCALLKKRGSGMVLSHHRLEQDILPSFPPHLRSYIGGYNSIRWKQIMMWSVFDKFLNDYTRMLRKYPNMTYYLKHTWWLWWLVSWLGWFTFGIYRYLAQPILPNYQQQSKQNGLVRYCNQPNLGTRPQESPCTWYDTAVL